jgi:hypothetical protein
MLTQLSRFGDWVTSVLESLDCQLLILHLGVIQGLEVKSQAVYLKVTSSKPASQNVM